MSTPKIMGLTHKTILAPEEGWKGETWYLVDVAMFENNVVHRALLYTGFLCEPYTESNAHKFIVGKEPAGYNCVFGFTGGYEDRITFDKVYYLKPVRIILTPEDGDVV